VFTQFLMRHVMSNSKKTKTNKQLLAEHQAKLDELNQDIINFKIMVTATIILTLVGMVVLQWK